MRSSVLLLPLLHCATSLRHASIHPRSTTNAGLLKSIYWKDISPAGNRYSISERDIRHSRRCMSMSSAAVVNAAARKAIFQLLSTCSIGVYASSKGILDKNSLSSLSKLIFNVFQPCLLFVSVSSTVRAAVKNGNGGTLAILPALAVAQVLMGFALGKLLSSLFYRDTPKAEASRFLRACTTFSNSGPLPFVFVDALFRGHPDPSLLPRSVAYISMYLLGWSPLFWMIAPGLLSNRSEDAPKQTKEETRRELFTRILSPPILGSLAGLAVGMMPAVMRLLLPGGPLNPLYEALRTLGAGYLPAVLLVLSGSLVPQPAAAGEAQTEEKFNRMTLFKEVGAIFLSKFFVMPIVGFALLRGNLPFLSVAAQDPLLMFVLLLETCMPSAQNLTVILQLIGDRFAAARMARLLLLVYVLGLPAMSFWLTRILRITKLF